MYGDYMAACRHSFNPMSVGRMPISNMVLHDTSGLDHEVVLSFVAVSNTESLIKLDISGRIFTKKCDPLLIGDLAIYYLNTRSEFISYKPFFEEIRTILEEVEKDKNISISEVCYRNSVVNFK